jgi:threonine dehydratase
MSAASLKSPDLPHLETIREALRRIEAQIHHTPVMTCASLDKMAGTQIYFKCENFQKCGAFKIRGATNAIALLSEEEARRGVVTHSSGNHAAALSLAARARGAAAWIVMPSNAPAIKKAAVQAYGGRITECEPTMAAREAAAREIIERTGAVMIHPYNDVRIIAGQGTAALEFLEQVPDLDFILAPVSGGGLLSGTAIAAKSLRPTIRVIGCEPKNADDAWRSLASGHVEPMEHPDTIADGLRASLCELTFAAIHVHVDEVALVSEEEIVEAMRHVWERMKIIVEPSAAVAAAVALFRKVEWQGKKVGVILSGGNVDLEKLPFKRLQ